MLHRLRNASGAVLKAIKRAHRTRANINTIFPPELLALVFSFPVNDAVDAISFNPPEGPDEAEVQRRFGRHPLWNASLVCRAWYAIIKDTPRLQPFGITFVIFVVILQWVLDGHIGVIAPYRAQVRKIRTILSINFPDVKVGTTEEFQGDERHAIIVSTVRSSLDFVEFDLRHTLGFVANPRRFNVAMTRAKSILIIIGDPDVLGLDPLWRQFLNHIFTHGGWRGIRIPWNPTTDVPSETSVVEKLPYDAQIRAKSEQDLRDLVSRASATGLGVLDEEDEFEADVDKHWHQDE